MALSHGLAAFACGVSLLIWWSSPPSLDTRAPVSVSTSAPAPAEFTSECQCPASAACEPGSSPVQVVYATSWEQLFIALVVGVLVGLAITWRARSVRPEAEIRPAPLPALEDRLRVATPSTRRKAIQA